MKKYFALLLIILSSASVFSQRKSYDIITYEIAEKWKEENGNGVISYSRIDGNSWGQLAIYQHRTSTGDAQTDFDKEWKEIIAGSGNIKDAPEKTEPQTADGWTVISGSATWSHNGTSVASVLTVYSNKEVCISILCNATAQPYLKNYQQLIASVKLSAPVNEDTSSGSDANANTDSNTTPSSQLAGIWEFYMNETSGTMITGGYFRREYKLNANGTYEFLSKTFSAYNPVIIFCREKGSWTVSNNQITIKPNQGKNEEWSKSASGRNMEWGKLIKTNSRKQETVTYTFDLKYLSGMEKAYLTLTSNRATERDGRNSNNDNSPHTFTYGPGSPDKPLVDLPPATSGKK